MMPTLILFSLAWSGDATDGEVIPVVEDAIAEGSRIVVVPMRPMSDRNFLRFILFMMRLNYNCLFTLQRPFSVLMAAEN
jgi:hypothetical protein